MSSTDHAGDPAIATAPATARAAAEKAFGDAVRHYRAGNHADAFRLVTEAVNLDPTFSEASLELARLLSAVGRADEAERVLRRGLEAAPRHFGLALNLGVLLCQTQRPADGLLWLELARDVRPAAAMGHYNVANAQKALGRVEDAVASYRDAIARDPLLAAAYGNLANCLAELGRVDEAAAAHGRATELRRDPARDPLPGDELATRTSAGKLRHDIEQIEYLLARGSIGPEYEDVLAAYRSALDRPAIEADYARNRPGITHVDGFLRPEALAGLRRFCLESTVWFQFKYANGYLGAYWEAGFWCPLLAQVAEGLRQALPGIFGRHTLRKCWAFKYDSRLSGIPMHADFAAVNVNFWVTPDAANLDPNGGGLVVWDKEAPADWDFADYNANETAMKGFLTTSGAKPVRIPHRQNRVVIFNSDLFHETDRIAFADGYENRRINITLLYGTRAS